MYANHDAEPPIRIAHGSQGPVASKAIRIDTSKLSTAISRELGKIFTNIEIVDVIVSPDADRDGNEMLRIEIVFTGQLRGQDAKNVAGAARKIMPTIDELVDDDDLYPLLSFVSKVDYDRRDQRARY